MVLSAGDEDTPMADGSHRPKRGSHHRVSAAPSPFPSLIQQLPPPPPPSYGSLYPNNGGGGATGSPLSSAASGAPSAGKETIRAVPAAAVHHPTLGSLAQQVSAPARVGNLAPIQDWRPVLLVRATLIRICVPLA